MFIDAHQHFWQYNSHEYSWIEDNMQRLREDFLPSDLKALFAELDFAGSVAVQARQSLAETKWLLSLAEQHREILGVVGWIDICSSDLQKQLAEFQGNPWLKGFRHVLQAEQASFMLQPEFIKGLKVLAAQQYSYDILVEAKQLPQVCELVDQLADLKFVVDHIAKPEIEQGTAWDQWRASINKLAQYPNVYCKLSGMVTQANWDTWTYADIEPYMHEVYQAFGSSRIMFGSDWPVCLLATDYRAGFELVQSFVNESKLESSQRQALNNVLRNSAIDFYKLALDKR